MEEDIMIEYKSGDILQADVEAVVNTVNCVGGYGTEYCASVQEGFP